MATIQSGDALILVDIQNDFLPSGALAVPRGDEVIAVLHGYIKRFESRGLPIYATRDWHPPDHSSFKEKGGIWPVHCVAGSPGAEPPASFHLPRSAIIVRKGTSSDREAYSGFQGTTLAADLKATGVRRLFIGGLATDYCVLNTVMDALEHGFDVILLADAIRAVNVHAGDGDQAFDKMVQRGAFPIQLLQLKA